MKINEDRLKALRMETPERIPVEVNILPAAWMRRREKLLEIGKRHPLLFESMPSPKEDLLRGRNTYREGQHLDAWGCVWSNLKTGMEAIVTGHPVPTRDAVRSLKIPEVDAGIPHGFLFLRLTDLRGFEEFMLDLAEEPPELQLLIDKVLAYNLRQANRKLQTIKEKGSIVYFGDDLGMQDRLPFSLQTWRKYFKPSYAKIYKPFKENGNYVYMHSDGHIWELIPDLIECGVDVVNPQVGANGLQNLAAVCKGKICVDLDLNRQMFPFWKPKDIEAHVREAVEILGMREGGLWLRAEIADDVPLENVEAVCFILEKYSRHYS